MEIFKKQATVLESFTTRVEAIEEKESAVLENQLPLLKMC